MTRFKRIIALIITIYGVAGMVFVIPAWRRGSAAIATTQVQLHRVGESLETATLVAYAAADTLESGSAALTDVADFAQHASEPLKESGNSLLTVGEEVSKIMLGTDFVSTDEPCLLLTEQNLQSPGSRGFHRYQLILVMRGDNPAEFRRDLGTAEAFRVQQFRIPGGARDDASGRFYVEHTVGELVDIADYIRGGFGTQPDVEPRDDLIAGYHQEVDSRKGRAVGKRSFGYDFHG